jgi:hypothetical protein
VRMLVPPVAQRREMDRKLVKFFQQHRPVMFRQAIAEFCRFYAVKPPRIGWFEYIDWGKAAGKTFEDGRIHLVHPENWRRGRIYKSERMWVQMVYHELAHYLFWTDPESKADAFMLRMVRGLKRPAKVRSAASRDSRTASPNRRAGSRTASAPRSRPSRRKGNRRRSAAVASSSRRRNQRRAASR